MLDNILAAPDIGLLAPEHMRASMPHDDDDPPPWQPLRIPHAADTSADTHNRSSARAASAGAGTGARSGPEVAAAGSSPQRANKQSRQQEEQQARSEQPRGEVLHKAKPGTAGRPPESPFRGADSAEGSGSASMQAQRSQEGDFFRLLDSPGPVPRSSFQESDLEQLPRSFSMSAKAKTPALNEPADAGSAEKEMTGSTQAQREADLMSATAAEPKKAADLASMPTGDSCAADTPQEDERPGAQPDMQPVLPNVPKHTEAVPDASDSADPSKEQPPSGAPAEGTTTTREELPEARGDPQHQSPAPNAEAAAPGSAAHDSSASLADEAAPGQLQGSQHEALPPPDHSGGPGLLGGAASSDLSYTQLTALLGDTEAQEDDLSQLDDLSPPGSPVTDNVQVDAADAEGLAAHAEAATAAMPSVSDQLDNPFPAEADLDLALGTARGDVALPDQHDSSAGDADLAETLEHARDEQRLEQISQQHAAKDLASNMERLNVLTGRQAGPISDAEHAGNMQRLAKLTGAHALYMLRLDECRQPFQVFCGSYAEGIVGEHGLCCLNSLSRHLLHSQTKHRLAAQQGTKDRLHITL